LRVSAPQTAHTNTVAGLAMIGGISSTGRLQSVTKFKGLRAAVFGTAPSVQ